MAQGVALRPATPADDRTLSTLATQVFLDTYARHGIDERMVREVHGAVGLDAMRRILADPHTRVVLAERDARLVGFAHWTPRARHELLPALPAAELDRLYVQEAATGAGVGSALVERVERDAAAEGVELLWLTAWVGNARALAFYARRGFTDAGSTPYTFEGESFENRVFAKRLP